MNENNTRPLPIQENQSVHVSVNPASQVVNHGTAVEKNALGHYAATEQHHAEKPCV